MINTWLTCGNILHSWMEGINISLVAVLSRKMPFGLLEKAKKYDISTIFELCEIKSLPGKRKI